MMTPLEHAEAAYNRVFAETSSAEEAQRAHTTWLAATSPESHCLRAQAAYEEAIAEGRSVEEGQQAYSKVLNALAHRALSTGRDAASAPPDIFSAAYGDDLFARRAAETEQASRRRDVGADANGQTAAAPGAPGGIESSSAIFARRAAEASAGQPEGKAVTVSTAVPRAPLKHAGRID